MYPYLHEKSFLHKTIGTHVVYQHINVKSLFDVLA
jgi:hypothetical protein